MLGILTVGRLIFGKGYPSGKAVGTVLVHALRDVAGQMLY